MSELSIRVDQIHDHIEFVDDAIKRDDNYDTYTQFEVLKGLIELLILNIEK